MASTLTEDKVFSWLESHQDSANKFVEKWIHSHPQITKKLCLNVQHCSSNHGFQPLGGQLEEAKLLKHYISSPNLPNNRKRKSNTELRQLTREELFMELLTDVVSPDFDVNHLSHKILANVLVLINGDRSSLFLVEGTEEQPILVSRLFDVMENTSVEDAVHDESEALKIPFGVGIIGYAAKMGETINLQDAYKDPRFNSQIDEATGFRTKSILCMPIKTPDGQVIGVAQVINKKGNTDFFTEQDEADFQTYLTFCAIGLINAQLLDQSFSLSRRLQALLQLTQGLFEDTTCLEVVMRKVMQQSLELIPSEKCAVLLIDQDCKQEVQFSRAFQVDHPKVIGQSLTSVRSHDLTAIADIGVATQVATRAEPMIVTQQKLGGKSNSTSSLLDKDTTSVLCMPIFDKDGHTIGIAKLANKLTGLPFNQLDRDTFEVFATFCGLGLHNVLMYEKISIAHARHKVAVEVLSYHASASTQETDKFMLVRVPEADQYHLHSYSFDDFPLNDDHTVLASIRMFLDSGVVERFKIQEKALYKWVLTVKRNYRPVTYHNWRHAFNVAQTMFAMYMTGSLQTKLNDYEKLALLVACFCHDLDHRGTNNAFQAKSDSPLAELYSTSTMEHHHLDHCIMILNSEGNQIFNGLSKKQYDNVMSILGSAILSTDLALYFSKKEEFRNVVKNHLFSWSNDSHRDLLRGMLMTACDVAAITKPWCIQRRVADMVANEFFEQGDVEREQLHSEPMAMMDRQKKHELPKMQVGFINFICMPLYEVLSEFSSDLTPLLTGVKNNRSNWQHLADFPDGNWDDPVVQEYNKCDSASHNIINVTPQCETNAKPVPVKDQETPDVSPEFASPIRCTTAMQQRLHEANEGSRTLSGPLIEAWRSVSDLNQHEQAGIQVEHRTCTEVVGKRKIGKCILC